MKCEICMSIPFCLLSVLEITAFGKKHDFILNFQLLWEFQNLLKRYNNNKVMGRSSRCWPACLTGTGTDRATGVE